MGNIRNHIFAQLFDLLRAIGHAIEGIGQHTDLVLAGRIDAQGIIPGADLPGDRCHLRQRPKHSTGQQKTEQEGQDQPCDAGPDQVVVDRTDKHMMDVVTSDFVLLHQSHEIFGCQLVQSKPDNQKNPGDDRQDVNQQQFPEQAQTHGFSLLRLPQSGSRSHAW